MELRLDLPAIWQPWLEPKRYKIAYGGRGGGKSEMIARLLLIRSLQKKIRILCAREIQKNIRESVLFTLENAIEVMGLQEFFEVGATFIRCKATGSEFVFAGLRHNINGIKSMGGIDIVWIEEAEPLSMDSWVKLDPTIRAPGSEIWFSYNPENEDSIVYKMSQNPFDDMLVTFINWRDNPWFPKELETQRARMAADPNMQDDYLHIWEGYPRKNLHAQILKGKWISEYFEPQVEWYGPYLGADWGFSNDPTTLVKVWLFEDTLYVEKEFYKVGLDIDKTPKEFRKAIPESPGFVITADSASPMCISYMQRNGFPRMVGAKKPKNSVMDGIKRLQGFAKIVIHPDCKETIQEARLWSWKVDRLTDEVLDEPKSGFDHCWDAVRYAIEKILLAKKAKRKKTASISFMER